MKTQTEHPLIYLLILRRSFMTAKLTGTWYPEIDQAKEIDRLLRVWWN